MSDLWRDRALCKDSATPEVWFPWDAKGAEVAIAICEGCPVRAECLEYALEHGEDQGIWGGVSERQRRTMRRKVDRQIRAEVKRGGLRGVRRPASSGECARVGCTSDARVRGLCSLHYQQLLRRSGYNWRRAS